MENLVNIWKVNQKIIAFLYKDVYLNVLLDLYFVMDLGCNTKFKKFKAFIITIFLSICVLYKPSMYTLLIKNCSSTLFRRIKYPYIDYKDTLECYFLDFSD